MAKYAHSDVLDGGLKAIKEGANEMWLLKAYAAADSYATVTANKICSVVMDIIDPTTDYVLSGADGASRVLTIASKSGTASASSGGTPNLHVALVSTTASKVLLVTDETSDQVVTSGNSVTFPSFTYTRAQPA